jgi:hypothetical protein
MHTPSITEIGLNVGEINALARFFDEVGELL